jgi:hypothetical protein
MRTVSLDDAEMEKVVEAFISSQNIVVISGAGISCSSGISVGLYPFQ